MLNSMHLFGGDVPQQFPALGTAGDDHVPLGKPVRSTLKKGVLGSQGADWAWLSAAMQETIMHRMQRVNRCKRGFLFKSIFLRTMKS